MEMIVKKVDGKLVAEVPSEALEALGAREGEVLSINPGRLSELRVKRSEQMAMAERIIEEERDVLEKLAKSERMGMVSEIMDEYDEALTELAK